MSSPLIPPRPPLWPGWQIRLRQVINALNLSTLAGLAVATAGGGQLVRGPHGTLLALDYRARFPAPGASAVTIGDVVLLRISTDALSGRPQLLDHEARHTFQYACWVGPLGFLPAYGLASAWSWYHSGHPALRNAFERRAGLIDGGYLAPEDHDNGPGNE